MPESIRDCVALLPHCVYVSAYPRWDQSCSCNNILRLPTRLCHAGQLTAQCTFAEADAAEAEFANIGARPSTDLAAIMLLHFELGLALRLHNHRDFCHSTLQRYFLKGMPISLSSRRPSSSVRAVVTILTSMPRTLSTLS